MKQGGIEGETLLRSSRRSRKGVLFLKSGRQVRQLGGDGHRGAAQQERSCVNENLALNGGGGLSERTSYTRVNQKVRWPRGQIKGDKTERLFQRSLVERMRVVFDE